MVWWSFGARRGDLPIPALSKLMLENHFRR